MSEIPYLSNSPEDIKRMLQVVGVRSIDDLFESLPNSIKSEPSPTLPTALSEYEIEKYLRKLADKNTTLKQTISFLGAGCYEHFIPSVVKHLAGRTEFVTTYTPYQAEASQGVLQAFFEYQSLICRLMNLPISNASLYDGASALAEAAILALSNKPNQNMIVVSETIHPEYLRVLKTYLKNYPAQIEIIPQENGITSGEKLSSTLKEHSGKIAGVVIQHPNFFGCLEDIKEISASAHNTGGLFIVVVDPISLGAIEAPGDYDADIAVAEGQSLGLDPYSGGETLGIFACKDEFLKKVPGRLIGLTKDKEGRRAFVLTLQTREQHIRREKATSNICSNQALNAIKASIYLAAVGPSGLKRIAETCASGVAYAKEKISKIDGVEIPFKQSSFKEFVIYLKYGSVNSLISDIARAGVFPGFNLEKFFPELKNHLLICVTETKSLSDIDYLAELIKDYIEIQR